jgi:CheY-like chemotaxis protein
LRRQSAALLQTGAFISIMLTEADPGRFLVATQAHQKLRIHASSATVRPLLPERHSWPNAHLFWCTMSEHSILIIDDDRISCGILAGCLSIYGFDTDVAYDGESALRLMEQKRYGLAITDYQMPGMNGVDLFKIMRELCGTLPGILVTSAVLEAGMREVISKPPDMPELVALIEEELSGRTTAVASQT